MEITVSGAGEITVPVVMAAAMTTSREAMASSRGWRMMSGFMVRRWFCPNADCGFCLRQGAENSSLRPLVGNGRYKSRKKADETVIILEPYTILFRIRSGGRNFASNGCCLLPLTAFMIPVLC